MTDAPVSDSTTGEPTWEDSALQVAAGLCGETGHKNFERYIVQVADALNALRTAVQGCGVAFDWDECNRAWLCGTCAEKRDAAIALLLGTTERGGTDV